MKYQKLNHPAAAAVSAVTLILSTAGSRADLFFDQNVTNNVIFGSGNANGSFTVDRNQDLGLELGLRAKSRFPASGTYNSNGDGVYVFGAPGTGQPNNRSVFNFEFSVNTNYNQSSQKTIGDYDYELFIDYDPSESIGNLVTFDPFNLPYADHSFGDNGTGNGGGQVAADPSEYAGFLSTKNLAQQSWNLGFFGTSTDGFSNGGGDQVYSIWLNARDKVTGALVGQTAITVSDNVDQMAISPIPEPSSALALSFLMSTALMGHRRRRQTVK